MNAIERRLNKGDLVLAVTGTATATAAVIATFDPECTAFRLKNLSSTQKLLYSIDGGTVYLTLEPLTTEEKERFARSIYVKRGSSTDVAYNAEYTEVQ